MKISYECSDIIEKLNSDIYWYGKDAECYIFKKFVKFKVPFTDIENLAQFFYDYSFELPNDKDIEFEKTTLLNALEIFEQQNEI